MGVHLTNASTEDRRWSDFYPTPSECTHAIVPMLDIPSDFTIWEPACGQGHISKELEGLGFRVVSSDLYDHGYGETGIDFLTAPEPRGDIIITNPPFSLSEQFIRKAISLGVPFAFLLKTQYWHAARRVKLFEEHRPMAIYPMAWRPDFNFGEKGGAPTMDALWVEWGATPARQTMYEPLRRPARENVCHTKKTQNRLI